MIYIVFIIDHIYNLINESKMLIFAYNSNQKVYVFVFFATYNTSLIFSHILSNLFSVLLDILSKSH